MKDVDRPNVGINFDPANMILYGTGDPIEALDVLGTHVIFRCTARMAIGRRKMCRAHWARSGRWARARWAWSGLFAKLKEVGFKGPLNVEREAENQEERMIDIAMGIQLPKV